MNLIVSCPVYYDTLKVSSKIIRCVEGGPRDGPVNKNVGSVVKHFFGFDVCLPVQPSLGSGVGS